jgi:hypothetical protein
MDWQRGTGRSHASIRVVVVDVFRSQGVNGMVDIGFGKLVVIDVAIAVLLKLP